MPLPHNDTVVTFPGGGLAERGTVLHVTTAPGQVWVLTDLTPFHPVDPRWPDQGPDRGVLAVSGRSVAVMDCVVGATDGSSLFVGDSIPVRRGEPGWAFVVVHVVTAPVEGLAEGDTVTLTVDAEHRAALSAGHTGCHVAALALNAALATRWRKPVGTDGLGSPDFDQLAIVSSRITPNAAVDTYRIGKSLRKKGFDSDGLAEALPSIVAAANESLIRWVGTGAPIELEVSGPRLTDLRQWVCELPGGTQRIACGGTHLRSLSEVDGISVGLRYEPDTAELTMMTAVQQNG